MLNFSFLHASCPLGWFTAPIPLDGMHQSCIKYSHIVCLDSMYQSVPVVPPSNQTRVNLAMKWSLMQLMRSWHVMLSGQGSFKRCGDVVGDCCLSCQVIRSNLDFGELQSLYHELIQDTLQTALTFLGCRIICISRPHQTHQGKHSGLLKYTHMDPML